MFRWTVINIAAALLGTTTVAAMSTIPSEHHDMDTPKQDVAHLVPRTHAPTRQQSVTVDGSAATLTRYERRDGRNTGLEGEHFSTVVAADGTLKGFAHVTLDLVGEPLPSRERAEAIARDFLKSHAPELLPRMQISWIEPHDESIRIQRNGSSESVTLTGMKVKARNLADGRWFWVIVGGDENPLVFERDIVWITFPGHRKTEKWLHDSWLKAQSALEAKCPLTIYQGSRSDASYALQQSP